MMVIFCLLAFLCVANAVDWDVETYLDEFVWREVEGDPYGYEVIDTYDEDGYSMHVLNMTSQSWMDGENVVEETVWWHYVSIAIPDEINYSDAFLLFIGSGNHGDSPPFPGSESNMNRIATFATNVGAVAAYIKCIPYQPTRFIGDTIGRTEDQIIARTWRLYIEMEVDDLDVILNLPMTRAAKRAVDTVIEYSGQVNEDLSLDKVLPTGFSKRGWATGLLAVSDRRVFAMAPTVIDALNWNPNLHHHYMAYGGWSWAFQPYWAEGVSMYIDHPRSEDIAEIIDPFYFNERLGYIPKMLTIASCDQFFLPDDSHYFFDDLIGIKYIEINENAEHSLSGQPTDRLWQNLESFFIASHSSQESFPSVTWERIETDDIGRLEMTVDVVPSSVRGWWADTTNVTVEVDEEGNSIARRDFRKRTLTDNNPLDFHEIAVEQESEMEFSLTLETPEEGFRGFFIEVEFDIPGSGDTPDLNFEFTSEIHIIPDVLPFPQCSSEEECRGTLK